MKVFSYCSLMKAYNNILHFLIIWEPLQHNQPSCRKIICQIWWLCRSRHHFFTLFIHKQLLIVYLFLFALLLCLCFWFFNLWLVSEKRVGCIRRVSCWCVTCLSTEWTMNSSNKHCLIIVDHVQNRVSTSNIWNFRFRK